MTLYFDIQEAVNKFFTKKASHYESGEILVQRFSPSTLDDAHRSHINKIVIAFQKRKSGILGGVEARFKIKYKF